MRRFDIGDKIRCTESGVRGICVKFYTPTACEEQTMVETADGRFYHGHYYWETEYPGKYLHMEFWV
jgi:hypothetical protein